MDRNMFKGKKLVIAILVLVCATGCTNQSSEGKLSEKVKTDVARQIVDRSIEKHGGLELWRRLEAILYTKRVILYDSLAEIESDIFQHHAYNFSPESSGRIWWFNQLDTTEIIWQGNSSNKLLNGSIIDSDAARLSAINIINSSNFVLFQPFKLLDPGTVLNHLGEETLKSGKKVNVVNPKYGNPKKEDDVWLFYFDMENDELIANKVDHLGRLSFIENLSFNSSSGLVLHKHRKSFFLDSLNNIRYLRAEYFYGEYELKFRE